MRNPNKKAYVISVDMGYGHERAAYGLRDLAGGEPIVANNYPGIPAEEKQSWHDSRKLYEAVSRLKPIPIIGNIAFSIMDKIQEIPPFYPRRDLSQPNLQLTETYWFIKKYNICKKLIDKLSENPLPIISTFFIPAFAAEMYDYPGDIYCVICDADFSRAWVPLDAKRSRIKYLAPCGRVVERLKLYGVPEKNIFLTGFPIPKELIGEKNAFLTKDILDRFCNLDPNGTFRSHYAKVLRERFGREIDVCKKIKRPLTLTFSVGGAGAQRHLGIKIVASLREKLRRKKIRINLVAGTRKGLASYFFTELAKLGIHRDHGSTGINVLVDRTRAEYFKSFTALLRETDILWTKPSELSFYTGVGLPIIMAPTIGSQEEFNRLWLEQVGGGIDQLDPEHTDEWLFDWVESGALARMAWNGYIEAPTHGAYRVEEVITGKKMELEQPPMIV
jgi:hypothetical protein